MINVNIANEKLDRFNYLVKKYPHLSKRINAKHFEYKCPACGKDANDLGVVPVKKGKGTRKEGMYEHLKRNHFDFLLSIYEEEDSLPDEDKWYQCPICGDWNVSMKVHARDAHGLGWEEFKKQTGFEKGMHFVGKAHREKVSKKKAAYYQRPEGIEYKKLQSEMFRGDKNPASRPEVRDKISKAHLGQKLPRKTKEKNSQVGASLERANVLQSLGYTYKLIYNDKYYYARSRIEFGVLISLLENSIPFEQEGTSIEYFDENEGIYRRYLPDFYVNGDIYEVKPSEEFILKDPKYKFIEKSLNSMGKHLNYLNLSTFYKLFNCYPLSKRQINEFIIKYIKENLLQIYPPVTTNNGGKYPYLRDLLGDNFKEILEENEVKFNENKKCRGL